MIISYILLRRYCKNYSKQCLFYKEQTTTKPNNMIKGHSCLNGQLKLQMQII